MVLCDSRISKLGDQIGQIKEVVMRNMIGNDENELMEAMAQLKQMSQSEILRAVLANERSFREFMKHQFRGLHCKIYMN